MHKGKIGADIYIVIIACRGDELQWVPHGCAGKTLLFKECVMTSLEPLAGGGAARLCLLIFFLCLMRKKRE